MKILTCEEMKKAENISFQNGLSYSRMMENAGDGCFKKIVEKFNDKEAKFVVLCGNGNNGGDGFVIARKLKSSGFSVKTVLCNGLPGTDLSKDVFSLLEKTHCEITDLSEKKEYAFETVENADILVDCVFGTGFRGNVEGDMAELFSFINKSGCFVFCVDVPSGINGDSKEVSENAIKADETFALCAMKPCHVFYPARLNCGEISVIPIGIDKKTVESCSNEPYYIKTFDEIKTMFPKRNPVSNKGDYGTVLSVCGSKRMPGAAVLSAKGVLRSGAGLLKAAFPDDAYPAIASKLTESVFLPLPGDKNGFLSRDSLCEILNELKWADVVLVGCGLGVTEDTCEIVGEIIKHSEVPIILDADGINIVSRNINILKVSRAPMILTPHPGEMSRLTGCSIGQIQNNRIQTAKEFARKFNVTLVLKGSNTIVCEGNEREAFVNVSGNAGMAKGGSGDLLSGIIAGFSAQGMTPMQSALCGVAVHSMAGDIASKQKSMMSALPSDVLECLPLVLSKTEE